MPFFVFWNWNLNMQLKKGRNSKKKCLKMPFYSQVSLRLFRTSESGGPRGKNAFLFDQKRNKSLCWPVEDCLMDMGRGLYQLIAGWGKKSSRSLVCYQLKIRIIGIQRWSWKTTTKRCDDDNGGNDPNDGNCPEGKKSVLATPQHWIHPPPFSSVATYAPARELLSFWFQCFPGASPFFLLFDFC